MDADLASPQPGALKPRAIAVLVALRAEPRTAMSLYRAIGDASPAQTLSLLDCMTKMELIGQRQGHRLQSDHRYLTHEGVGWLETNGLSVDDNARLPGAPGSRTY